MAKPYCNALNCTNLRIRPQSTHCPSHEAEWHAIQRDQRHGITLEIRQRRLAMGMIEFPGGHAAGRAQSSEAHSRPRPRRGSEKRTPMGTVRAELVAAFSESISLKVKVAREVELEMRERRRLLESISEDIKKYTDLLQPLVSVGAQAEAARRGVDLREMVARPTSIRSWSGHVPVGAHPARRPNPRLLSRGSNCRRDRSDTQDGTASALAPPN